MSFVDVPPAYGDGTSKVLYHPRFPMEIRASSTELNWSDLDVHLVEGILETPFALNPRSNVASFFTFGKGTLEWQRDGSYRSREFGPGAVNILPQGGENVFRLNNQAQVLTVWIPQETLTSIVAQEPRWNGHPFELIDLMVSRDKPLFEVGRRLVQELATPHFGSRLYADTLQRLVCMHILRTYSSLPRMSRQVVERLDDLRLQRVVEYIQDNFAQEVSLSTLAQVAGLSPQYLVVAFRKATGRSPHQFLLEQRVRRAELALQDFGIPIFDIARSVGFSTQSHLTTVFKRFLGVAPSAYRKDFESRRRGGQARDG